MPKHHDHHGRSGLFGLGIGALSFGAVASAAAGVHKVAETAVQLRKLWDVGEDNMVFVRILERVRLDLREVERLMALNEVKRAMERTPEKVRWIAETIHSVRVALDKTAQFTLRVKKDTDRGMWVGLRNRIWFRLEEFEKLEVHTLEVARCHAGLLQVLALLTSIETGQQKHIASYSRHDEGRETRRDVTIHREHRDDREIHHHIEYDDFSNEGDIVYTRPGDGPGYSAEIALDRFDGQQLEAQFAHTRRYTGDDSRTQHGEHITEVEVDRVVERDDGRRVEAHYTEKHGEEASHHHHRADDERYIDVKRRAEVRRHHGSDHVTKLEVDGYETRDDGRRVEAHYTEEIEDDRRSQRKREHRDHRDEERYIDVERRAEIRRR